MFCFVLYNAENNAASFPGREDRKSANKLGYNVRAEKESALTESKAGIFQSHV